MNMRQGRFLFVVLSMVGLNEVLGQFVPTGVSPSIDMYYTNSNIGIGFSNLPSPTLFSKLQVVGTSSVPSAVFSSGNVGI